MKIEYRDVYETYCKLLMHSEVITWQRFHFFLVINSVLLLAWVTLFRDARTLAGTLVMTAIPTIGALAAIAWADLGDRGRKYLDAFKEKAKRIEQDCDKQGWWEDGIAISDRPYQIDLSPNWYSGSRFLLSKGPYVFLLLHAGLIAATWLR
jgi:hypothetical protein